MRIIMVCLLLTLAACDSGSGYSSRGSSSSEDAATWLLLGGAAFANGYTQRSRPALTCFNYGSMMTCD